MARYIDAERLCRGLRDMASVQYPDRQHAILGVISTIENFPTADVVEVRHGEWVHHESTAGGIHDTYRCSICGVITSWTTKFCPNCGAKMDGRRDT